MCVLIKPSTVYANVPAAKCTFYVCVCVCVAPVVTLDEKCWYLHFVLSLPTALVGPFLYPRVYALVSF